MAIGAWRQFLDQPLLGSHALELGSYTYPHNVLLESLMATGVLGFALLLGSMGPATLAALRIIRAESQFMWIALIYLQYVVHCMVSGSLYLEASFWSFAFGSLAVTQAISQAKDARRP
jgi:O-antigen ligase